MPTRVKRLVPSARSVKRHASRLRKFLRLPPGKQEELIREQILTALAAAQKETRRRPRVRGVDGDDYYPCFTHPHMKAAFEAALDAHYGPIEAREREEREAHDARMHELSERLGRWEFQFKLPPY